MGFEIFFNILSFTGIRKQIADKNAMTGNEIQIIGINVRVTDKSPSGNYCVDYVKIYLSTGEILCFAEHFIVL